MQVALAQGLAQQQPLLATPSANISPVNSPNTFTVQPTTVLEGDPKDFALTSSAGSEEEDYILVHPSTEEGTGKEQKREEELEPEAWKDGHIPYYVLEYAPLIHLYSGESYWPGDIAEHLQHTQPYHSFTPLSSSSSRQNLSSLRSLNNYSEIFLTSDDDPQSKPAWLGNTSNIPSSSSGKSDAPAALVVIQKPHGIVDAFWFFFYSYNQGNSVLGIRFGNHVGDWEHTLVRFQHGEPKQLFFSEHAWGQAYSYQAVEKKGKRPVGYSATGSHAMYATPGSHQYALPLGLLYDTTDRGPLWDPALNSYMYTYDLQDKKLFPAGGPAYNASVASFHEPGNVEESDVVRLGLDAEKTVSETDNTGWFFFNGRWGDKRYPMTDGRQYQFAGNYHFDDGPTGPRFKNLARKSVCQSAEGALCVIRHWLPSEELDLCEWHGFEPEDKE